MNGYLISYHERANLRHQVTSKGANGLQPTCAAMARNRGAFAVRRAPPKTMAPMLVHASLATGYERPLRHASYASQARQRASNSLAVGADFVAKFTFEPACNRSSYWVRTCAAGWLAVDVQPLARSSFCCQTNKLSHGPWMRWRAEDCVGDRASTRPTGSRQLPCMPWHPLLVPSCFARVAALPAIPTPIQVPLSTNHTPTSLFHRALVHVPLWAQLYLRKEVR